MNYDVLYRALGFVYEERHDLVKLTSRIDRNHRILVA